MYMSKNIFSQFGEKEFYQKLTFLENVLKSWRDGESVCYNSKDSVQCSVGPFECDILNGNHFRLGNVLATVVYFLLPG